MKLRWRNRRQGWNGSTKQTQAIERAAFVGNTKPKKIRSRAKGTFGPAGPARSLTTGETLRDIWITVGADCPWNTTPGTRQVHHFKSIEKAHAAGFTAIS